MKKKKILVTLCLLGMLGGCSGCDTDKTYHGEGRDGSRVWSVSETRTRWLIVHSDGRIETTDNQLSGCTEGDK